MNLGKDKITFFKSTKRNAVKYNRRAVCVKNSIAARRKENCVHRTGKRLFDGVICCDAKRRNINQVDPCLERSPKDSGGKAASGISHACDVADLVVAIPGVEDKGINARAAHHGIVASTAGDLVVAEQKSAVAFGFDHVVARAAVDRIVLESGR